jgi:hypothetical protein
VTALVVLIFLVMVLLAVMSAFAVPWLAIIPAVLATIAIVWLVLSAISPRPVGEQMRRSRDRTPDLLGPGHEDDPDVTGPGR